MSQGFKLKYDSLQNNTDMESPNTNEGFPAGLLYESEGPTRHVCFVRLDGSRIFLNYAYLVSGEYIPDTNMIVLAFTTHLVTLKGVHLEALYYQLMKQSNKQIICIDERYNDVQGDNAAIVNQIEITSN